SPEKNRLAASNSRKAPRRIVVREVSSAGIACAADQDLLICAAVVAFKSVNGGDLGRKSGWPAIASFQHDGDSAQRGGRQEPRSDDAAPRNHCSAFFAEWLL